MDIDCWVIGLLYVVVVAYVKRCLQLGLLGNGVESSQNNKPLSHLTTKPCHLLFSDSCEEKDQSIHASTTTRKRPNIEPCTACAEKCVSHTQPDAKKRCNNKTQIDLQTVL